MKNNYIFVDNKAVLKKNKFISLFYIFLCISVVFGTEQIKNNREYIEDVPKPLEGIWQGNDRLVLFNDKAPISIVLRVFYQWYDDRAAEPSSFAQISSRDRNDTISSHPENIEVKFFTLFENESKTAGIYELSVKYPKIKNVVYIPIAVIDNQLYLTFLMRENINYPDLESNKDFYLKDYGVSNGITISPPIIKDEIISYYVTGNSVYHIRYWESKMDFSEEKAEFSTEEKNFFVDKFIKAGGKIYTCTTGRSKKIRNIQKSTFISENFIIDNDSVIYAYGKPYLIKVPSQKTEKDFCTIVESNNSKRKPPQTPPFPASEIDFHWKEISEIEKYNPYTWNRRNIDLHK